MKRKNQESTAVILYVTVLVVNGFYAYLDNMVVRLHVVWEFEALAPVCRISGGNGNLGEKSKRSP